MNTALLVLQVLAALLYGASGFMKVFMFEKIRHEVPSFGALPPRAWMALGLVELACVAGLLVPAVLGAYPAVAGAAAVVLALESLVFIGVHVKYREVGSIVMSAVLGLVMAFVAYGRLALPPAA